MWVATPSTTIPVELGLTVHVLGLTAFFAGVAVGLLLVFADRHGYKRPVPLQVVAVLLATGAVLTFAGWVGQQLGF